MYNDDYEEQDTIEEPDEGEVRTYTDEWGVTWEEVYSYGEWRSSYNDPSWDNVFDENEDYVTCPFCGEDELRYHDGEGRCISCKSVFSDEEIERYVGDGWFHL